MNIVMLSGYATKLPELTKTKNGVSRTEFKIAVKDNRGGQTEFITCVAWNKLAERIKKHVIKGTYVEVQGHIKVSDFKGYKGYIHIVADNVRFVYTPEESRKRHEQEKKEQGQQVEKQQERSTHQHHDEKERQERPVQQQVEQQQERPAVEKESQQKTQQKPKNRVIMGKEPEVKKVTQNNQRTFEVDFSDVNEDDLPF